MFEEIDSLSLESIADNNLFVKEVLQKDKKAIFIATFPLLC